MNRVEVTHGAIVDLEWFFSSLGVDAQSIRTSHITVEVIGERARKTLNNISGGVVADIKRGRVKSSIKTVDNPPGVYQVWVTVLKKDRSEARNLTHTLVAIDG